MFDDTEGYGREPNLVAVVISISSRYAWSIQKIIPAVMTGHNELGRKWSN